MAAICAAAPLALANKLPLPTIVQHGWSRHCRCKYRYKRIRPLPFYLLVSFRVNLIRWLNDTLWGLKCLPFLVAMAYYGLILVPTQLFLHRSLLPLLIHNSVHTLLPLSFTPGLKPTCCTNPTTYSFTFSWQFLLDWFHELLPVPFLFFPYFLFLGLALD